MDGTRVRHQNGVAVPPAVLAERCRLARELHDTLAQKLHSLVLRLGTAKLLAGDPAWAAGLSRLLDEAGELARDGLAEARRCIDGLRPAELESGCLAAALAAHAERVAARAGVAVTARCETAPPVLDPGVAAELFRIAQEAVANAVKHGRPTEVRVTLAAAGECLTLTVADDGCGYDGGAVAGGGHGLVGMRERAELIGAALAVRTARGAGTTITVALNHTVTGPLQQPTSAGGPCPHEDTAFNRSDASENSSGPFPDLGGSLLQVPTQSDANAHAVTTRQQPPDCQRLSAAMEGVRRRTTATDWRAFWLTAVEGHEATGVGRELGLSVGAVWVARCQVLYRIRVALSSACGPDSSGDRGKSTDQPANES